MIRFAVADLRRLWAASLVVVLLVALATALGVAVTLQERALRLGSARAADKFDLIIGAPGSDTQLVLSSVFLQPAPLPLMAGDVLTKLTADPRVAWAAPIGFGDNFKGLPIVGTTRALISGTTTGFTDGRMFAIEGEAVVGSAVTLALGAEIKPMHGAAGEEHHHHGHIDAYALRQAYRAEGQTRAVFPAEVLTSLYATLGDARMVLMYVAYGAELLVAAALILIAVIHVAQRRRQIGALRAFGAPRLAVFGIVWLELLLLVVVGVGAGFGLGYVAAEVLAGLFTAQSGVHLPVEFTRADGYMALTFLAVASLMAVLPALLAYGQSPVEALRR